MLMKNKILVVASLSLFAVSASAYEITTKSGSSVSGTLSVNSYSVTGHVTTITDSNRGVLDYSGGILTVGDMNKHTVVDVIVNQGGAGVGVSGSSTVYAGISHGNVEVGGSASVGTEGMNSVSWDNSVIHETGTAVTDVDLYAVGGWFPVYAGSSTETVQTNTWVNLANVDYTASSGSWSSNTVYIK